MSSFDREDECKSCRAKPGSPLLCDSCLLRQTEYAKYHWARKLNGHTIHAFLLPLGDPTTKAVCDAGVWRKNVLPAYLNMPRCKKCVQRLDARARRKARPK